MNFELLLFIAAFSSVQLFKISKRDLKPIVDNYAKCPFGYTGKDCKQECGKSFFGGGNNRQIVGGNEAIPHAYPSVCHLTIKYKFILFGSAYFLYFECTGSLISPNVVLTAGHCVTNETNYPNSGLNLPGYIDSITVAVGVHNISDISQGIRYKAKKVIRNDEYDEINLLNDIALVELENNVILNEHVQLACLPDLNITLADNSTSTAVGWGTTSSGGYLSDVLRTVDLTIYNGSVCNKTGYYDKNWNSQICAGDLAGLKDTCQGDSGGPLYLKSKISNETRYYVVGVTSYGIGCATRDLPGIYTRTSYFSNWIKKNLE